MRILVATSPLAGHVAPAVPLVRRLVARGHRVRWCSGPGYSGAIAATGAEPATLGTDEAEVDAALARASQRRGVAQVKAQLAGLFIEPATAQLRALERAAADLGPDLVLADAPLVSAELLAERGDLPWATFAVTGLSIPSEDTAPFGLAWRPGRGPLARRRNRVMNELVRRRFADLDEIYRRTRAAAGLPAAATRYLERLSPHLALQPTVPSFEYPRRRLPPQVRFIGPLLDREGRFEPPAWWTDLEGLDGLDGARPIVFVTQGSLATDGRALLAPALRGLAGEDVLVVATTGPGEQPRGRSVGNARLARFIPFHVIVPRAAVMVTNGGYGGVQMALAHGVPLVIAAGSEDKPEVAARVAWAGAGIDLGSGRPGPARVRAAVRRVLRDGRFRRRARAIADEMSRHDAPGLAADLLERLAHPPGGLPGPGEGLAGAGRKRNVIESLARGP